MALPFRHRELLFWSDGGGMSALLIVLVADLVAILACVVAGRADAALLGAVALLVWSAVIWLQRSRHVADRALGKIAPCAPAAALALSAIALVAAAHSPLSAKFFYSAIMLSWIVGSSAFFVLRWATSTMSPELLLVEAFACSILLLWMLFSDSDWHININSDVSDVDTRPYLVGQPLWWWTLFVAIPALIQGRIAATRIGHTTSPLPAWHTNSRLFAAALIVIFLMAALQAWDCVHVRFGGQMPESDAYGYLVYAYRLLEVGLFEPPHMPLISLYLAGILAMAGDGMSAIIVTNVIILLVGVAAVIRTLWLISEDRRVVVLGGLLIVSLRTLYLFVWIPMTELPNTVLWAVAFMALVAAVRRPTVRAHIALGLTIALLLMLRSQNIGGVVGLALCYGSWIVFVRNNREALPAARAFALVLVVTITASVPLLAWGTYNKAAIGEFKIMDGRGPAIVLGMNMPGIIGANTGAVWEPNVKAWMAEHPGATETDMLVAALRYRVEWPVETLYYFWSRALLLFNFRLSPTNQESSYADSIRVNIQLIILLVTCILLLLMRERWLAFSIWTIFFCFIATFMAIHAEWRYRVPMDPLMMLGATVVLARTLFGSSAPVVARKMPATSGSTNRLPIFVTLLAACAFIVVTMRVAVFVMTAGKPGGFVGADLHARGAVDVLGKAFDPEAQGGLPTWDELVTTTDFSMLEGKQFRGRFNMMGHLLKIGTRYHYAQMDLKFEELPRIQPVDKSISYPVSGRMAVSFDGARVERGIKQRGEIEMIGRVRTAKAMHASNRTSSYLVIINAINVNCARDSSRQRC